MPDSKLVKTGVNGLDAILSGGIPRGNVILLEGAICNTCYGRRYRSICGSGPITTFKPRWTRLPLAPREPMAVPLRHEH